MNAPQRTSRRLVPGLGAASALALGLASAQISAQTPAPAAARPAASAPSAGSPRLNVRDIYDRVEAAGYRDIREIEFEPKRGRYEVKSLDAQGQRVKLYVDAATGAIERAARR